MNRHFIIDIAVAGLISATVFTGCKSSSKYCDLGMECFNASDYSGAVENFQKAVDSNSKDAKYLVYLGMAQIETCDYAGAVDSFTTAISTDDKNRDAYRGLGIAYLSQENIDDAIDSFTKAIDLSENKYDQIHIDSLKYLGTCYMTKEMYNDAVDSFTSLVNKSGKGDKDEAYYLRGCAYIELGDENDAVLDFEDALDSNNEDYQMCCSIYSAFNKAGYEDRAQSYLKRVINSEDADNLLIGKTYYMLGSFEEAREYLLDAYDEGENDAAFYLAMTYEASEEYDKAVDLYQEYLGKHANDPKIYNQYGAYLINRGSYKDALIYLEEGIDIAAEDDTAMQSLLYNQAVCYEYTGDYEKSLELFETYVGRYPSDKKAQKEYLFLQSR